MSEQELTGQKKTKNYKPAKCEQRTTYHADQLKAPHNQSFSAFSSG